MKSIFLAHISLPDHGSGTWGLVALMLLIFFVTLAVSEGSSKGRDK
ncbi:MAG TPA: hypothetical protein VH251_08810 [Verrucomicrobiae bacterium]|nr:hypothetical protein [Verrucomicrobiae bacterium]